MNIIKEKNMGNLVVISGPSGAGKDSIIENLKKINKNFWVSISMTTRAPRTGEVDGKSYFFVSKEEFEDNIKKNNFLEYATYNGEYYGTPKSKILDKLQQGIDVILEIEIQGALKIKEILPETLFIFILPPSMNELKKRLINRKTDSKEKIISRFKRAYQEINEVTKYNYVVINDDLEDATNKVNSILVSERLRVDRIEDVYLGNMEEELHELLVEKDLENNKLEF